MGFFKTMGKGVKKIGKAAKDYDSFRESNYKKQMHTKQSELKSARLETALLREKDKQKKYKKDSPFGW